MAKIIKKGLEEILCQLDVSSTYEALVLSFKL